MIYRRILLRFNGAGGLVNAVALYCALPVHPFSLLRRALELVQLCFNLLLYGISWRDVR